MHYGLTEEGSILIFWISEGWIWIGFSDVWCWHSVTRCPMHSDIKATFANL